MGQVLTDRGRAAEAAPLRREALAIREAKLDSTDLRIPESRWAARQAAGCHARTASLRWRPR